MTARIKHTISAVNPDLRCDDSITTTTTTTWDDELDLTIDCVLHFEHEGDHTDGDGTFWDEDGEVERR